MSGKRRRIPAGSGTSAPMFVLAGLPPEVHNFAKSFLEGIRSTAIVVGAPSPQRDGALYPKSLVETLLRATASFAFRRRTKGPEVPLTPKSITLLYVPACDDERLLRAFDFAVWTGALSALAAYGEGGRQLRHNRAALEAALREAAGSNGWSKHEMDQISQRINRLSDREALLLSPRNYHLREAELGRLFLDYRRGLRPVGDRFADLHSVDLTCEDLPRRLGAEEVRHAYVDDREVAFLTAHPTAYHGTVREVEENTPQPQIHSLLRSLYRFGAALPCGFHHDAQPSDGTSFDKFHFFCDEDGDVEISGTHANIYSNDFVRASTKTKIK